MTIRFDDAWRGVQAVGRITAADTGLRTIALRDLIGRVSLVIDDRTSPGTRFQPNSAFQQNLADVVENAGPFVAPSPILRATDLIAPEAIFSDPAVIWDVEQSYFGRLERGVVGAEWARTGTTPAAGRIALYGFKGGVGRSTATFMLARHLATRGMCVLVIDLDLESPGVGPLIEEIGRFPPYGIIDQLVESAVGNAADLEIVGRSSRIRGAGNGEVWLAPAGGSPRDGYDYLAKLNRVYADVPTATGTATFADRLTSAIAACEDQVERLSRAPDVVLLDSRAGLHDIAAVVLTQLADLSLLFAADNRQTWSGYSMLFNQWRDAHVASTVRERLRTVSAMTPANTHDYLRSFSDHAQACFSEYLYDDAAPGDAEAFNPSPDDDSAPHSPIPIHFVGELVGLDADSRSEWFRSDLVEAAYRDFLSATTALIVGDLDG